VQRWRDWWTDHQAEYPRALEPSRELRQPAHLTAREFALNDSDGKLVHLSDYHRKVVLLAFWTLDAPVSLDDASALNALHNRNPGVTVLGVCIPPAPSCAEEHEQGGGHEHHHRHGASSPALNTKEARELVRAAAQQRQINYPTLIDANGKVASRFAVEELPTYALIDADGMIRRRFIGSRTQPAFEAMLEEMTNAKPQLQSKKR
jgi:peroxiredoxin